MRVERITNWQLAMVLSGFLIGTSSIIMPLILAGRNGWLSALLVIIPAIFSFFVSSQLSLIWNKPFIQGIATQIGPMLGAIVALLYLFYLLILSALITTVVGFLSKISVMPETPLLIFSGGLVLLCSLAIRGGLESLGRLAEILLPLVILAISIGVILTIATPQLVKWDYLLPLIDEGWLQTLRSSCSVFSFPFGETIVFAFLLPFVIDLKKSQKQSMLAIVLIGLLLCGTSLLQTAVLGEEITRTSFPGLALLREVRVADFLTRLEVLGIFVWTFASFIKLSTCFWALTHGLGQLLGLPDYRPLIFPLGLIITVLSVTTVKNFSELMQFTTFIYPLYTFPLQVLFPLLLLILAQLKPSRL